MMYLLIFIRLAFYFLVMMMFVKRRFGLKIGFSHPRIQPMIFWMKQFHQHMKTSDNARKFFILLLIILMVIAQAIDLTLVSDYGFMQLSLKESYIQFGLGMILTIAMFRYPFSDRILSFKCKPFYLLLASELILLACCIWSLVILMDVYVILLIGTSIYPQKKGENEPKGRKPIPIISFKESRFRKAAMFFRNYKMMGA